MLPKDEISNIIFKTFTQDSQKYYTTTTKLE